MNMKNKRKDLLAALAGDYLRTPGGSWGDTQQAWRDLDGECRSPAELRLSLTLAIERGTIPHPSRSQMLEEVLKDEGVEPRDDISCVEE